MSILTVTQFDDPSEFASVYASQGALYVSVGYNVSNCTLSLRPLSDFAGQATTVSGTTGYDKNHNPTFTLIGTVSAT